MTAGRCQRLPPPCECSPPLRPASEAFCLSCAKFPPLPPWLEPDLPLPCDCSPPLRPASRARSGSFAKLPPLSEDVPMSLSSCMTVLSFATAVPEELPRPDLCYDTFPESAVLPFLHERSTSTQQ